jgi:DNA-directed RNA polymerase specialized sigma24 family protein
VSILDELAKQNNKWQAYAFKICNDIDIANDLVQEMYLKFHRNKYTKTDAGYVYWALKNLYRDTFKNKLQTISIDELLYLRNDGDDGDEFRFNRNIDKILKCQDYDYEPSDVDNILKQKLEGHDAYYAELALMNADGKSLRKLAYLYKKNHVTIHLNIKKIKNSLLEDQEVKEVYLSLK